MFYVYDNYGAYYAKTDSFRWAKKMADSQNGYVMEWFDGGYYLAYDSCDFLWEIFD